MPKGTVKWFDIQKGFGFLQREGGGSDVFVHQSAVEKSGLQSLTEGQAVEFEEEDGPKGPRVTTLKLVES
jgi:CspA family cold shock protein